MLLFGRTEFIIFLYFHFVLKLNRNNASRLYCLTQLFTTPDECPSFVPLPTLVVRCLEVTVKNAEAGVRFTFKAKGFKCMFPKIHKLFNLKNTYLFKTKFCFVEINNNRKGLIEYKYKLAAAIIFEP